MGFSLDRYFMDNDWILFILVKNYWIFQNHSGDVGENLGYKKILDIYFLSEFKMTLESFQLNDFIQ